MKNKYSRQKFFAALLFIASLAACKPETTAPAASPKQNTPKDTIVTLEDTLCRNWEVKTATHNGTNDPSSVGLKLTINKNGTYLLHSTSYAGTWEFIENKTKVLLDKNTPQYKTTWTIVSMSSKKLNVKFKSPFTGGSAEWFMTSYQ